MRGLLYLQSGWNSEALLQVVVSTSDHPKIKLLSVGNAGASDKVV